MYNGIYSAKAAQTARQPQARVARRAVAEGGVLQERNGNGGGSMNPPGRCGETQVVVLEGVLNVVDPYGKKVHGASCVQTGMNRRERAAQ